MPEDPTYPGVNAEESASRVQPIEGVDTSSGLDEGQAAKPIEGVPTSNAPRGRGRFGFLGSVAALARRRRRPPSP
jgi:hypothetical protein